MATWMTVPVREDFLGEVLALIQEKLKGDQVSPERESSTVQRVVTPEVKDSDVQTYHGGFTKDELRDMLLKPTRAMGILLRHFATHPETDVTRTEMAELAYGEGASPSQLSGALGSFTRRNRGRYGKDAWPFYVSGYDEERQQWLFKMDARTAEAIREILGL